MQKLQMTSINNLLCALLHRGTDGQKAVTDEMICLVAIGEKGVCGGKKTVDVSFNNISWRNFKFQVIQVRENWKSKI